MPWENRSGGRGPWGQSPSGGGRGDGPQPPDLEELFKRGKDRLRGVLPPGGLRPGAFAIVALVLIGGWLATGFYSVQPNEQGLVLRFGAFDRTTTQGLNYALPWPIETVEVIKVTNENQINIGFKADQDGARREGVTVNPEESLMLTGDENIVDISFSVVWVIKDAVQYRFTLVEPDAAAKAVAEAAMREVVGRSRVQDVLTENRVPIQDDVLKLMQSVLDSYGAGISILRVQIQKAEVPAAVIDAFRDVQAAKTEADQMRNEAQAYANKVVPEARGEAERILQQADGYKASTVAQAQGEAARFISIYDEYTKAPDVTRRRLYLETMERVLGGVNKVVIDQKNGSNVLPYLPLDQLMRRGGANTPTPRGSQ